MAFSKYITNLAAQGTLAIQPRMGFPTLDKMQNGLAAVKAGPGGTIGTITVDAYTRVGQEERAQRALRSGSPLNGFPITVHPTSDIKEMLCGISDEFFPLQVRHGSADPRGIFKAAIDAGLHITEGGPVSYNFPYSRVPLTETVSTWREAVLLWAETADRTGEETHIESFGGCMLGQLCPPSLLITLSVLEARFFADLGVSSVSLSLAQGPSFDQDVGALIAMKRLAERHLQGVNSHAVFYTFMGLFPETLQGAELLIRDSARIARTAGAERLIVKTAAEARGIPSIEDNLTALHWARESADAVEAPPTTEALAWADIIESEALTLIESVIGLDPDVGQALIHAFAKGILDVPFCLHPDNAGLTRAGISPESGGLIWAQTGNLPITPTPQPAHTDTADSFHKAIQMMRQRYDAPHLAMEDQTP